MKYLVHTIILGLSLTTLAQDAPKTSKSQGKKGPPKELLEKYDTNKDGKLDQEERSKVSKEDKKSLRHAAEGQVDPLLLALLVTTARANKKPTELNLWVSCLLGQLLSNCLGIGI